MNYFTEEDITYINGEKFSTSRIFHLNKERKKNISRLEYIKEIVKNKQIIHLGFADHLSAIERKLDNKTWLHDILLHSAKLCVGIDNNKESIQFIQKKYNTQHNPIDFVFHGGSGSTLEEIREAITYGVVKMNIDTDLQFAFNEGVRNYMIKNIDYLKTQIGNPEGTEKPNKKFYDPRKWLREGELSFSKRLEQAFHDLKNVNTL